MNLAAEHRELGRLRRREEILKRRAKAAAVETAAHERAMYDRMIEDGWTPNKSSIKLDGVTHRPAATDYAVVQDKAELVAWLKENDAGVIESEKLRKGELDRLVRERLQNGQPLPPGLGYWTKTYISTRGATTTTQEDTHADEGE